MKTLKKTRTVAGYPAFRVLRFRLRDIGPFRDTGEVTLHSDINLFLGDNTAGKTTLLRCLALAAVGSAAANEVSDAKGYLRKGAKRGSIEVLFQMLSRPDASPDALHYFATGLEIPDGESRFVPLKQITLKPPDTFTKQRTITAEALSAMRSRGDLFGFVAAYGAVRTFTESRTAIQPEEKKRENEWVLSLFKPEAWLADSEGLSKLLRGDASNIEGAPKSLSREVVDALRAGLKRLAPDVSDFYFEGQSDVQLYQTALKYGDLSDGYRNLFALVGHLLRCALRVRNWKEDPTTLHGIALIDEIDVHLHPVWQRHVVEDFRKAFPNMQLIASTHSPLVVGALKREHVRVMRREQDGSIAIEYPSVDPQGLGFGGILKSELFGLRSTVDSATLRKIDRRNSLFSKGDQRKPEENEELERLSEELAGLGFAMEFNDPYYAEFVARMARHTKFHRPVLTPEERKEQDAVADSIIDSLLAKETNK